MPVRAAQYLRTRLRMLLSFAEQLGNSSGRHEPHLCALCIIYEQSGLGHAGLEGGCGSPVMSGEHAGPFSDL